MSQPKNSSTSTITPTFTHRATSAVHDVTSIVTAATAADTNTSSTYAGTNAKPIPIPKQPSRLPVTLTRRGNSSSSQSSSSFVFDSSSEWEEPHPGQRLVFGPLHAGSCSCSSEDHSSLAEVAVGSGSDSVCSDGGLGSDNVCGSRATAGVSRNDTAAKGLDQSQASSSSSSSMPYRHRHHALTPLWFTQHRSHTRDEDAVSETAARLAPLHISITENGSPNAPGDATLSRSAPASSRAVGPEDLLPPSPLSPPPPKTPAADTVPVPPPAIATSWLSLDTDLDDDADDEDHPLSFRIDCDVVCEMSTDSSPETITIAATTLYGDERTITSSDGDASTVRGVVVPVHPLTDFSNFLGMRSPVPPRSIVTQDSISTIRQSIGSRHSNNTDDTISASFVVDPSRLSHATTANHDDDDDDLYGWEAELEHRKSTSCPTALRPSIVDDVRLSINKNSHSNSSSSSNSVMSSGSERGDTGGYRRREGRPRRQSFLQRVFSGIGTAHNGGKDVHAVEMPATSAAATVPTADALHSSSSPAESSPNDPSALSLVAAFPGVPQLAMLLSNFTTMRDSNRI